MPNKGSNLVFAKKNMQNTTFIVCRVFFAGTPSPAVGLFYTCISEGASQAQGRPLLYKPYLRLPCQINMKSAGLSIDWFFFSDYGRLWWRYSPTLLRPSKVSQRGQAMRGANQDKGQGTKLLRQAPHHHTLLAAHVQGREDQRPVKDWGEGP